MTPPNSLLAGRLVRMRAGVVDIVGAFILYTVVKLVGGEIRGVPYPDPAPIAPFLITYALYLAVCVSLPDRNTLGEKLHSIVPVTADGKRLILWQWIARVVLLSSPWAGWLLLFDTSPGKLQQSTILLTAPSLMAVVLYGVLDLVMLVMRRTPRALTDRLLRIAVVYLPPLQPHRAPAGPMYSATDREFGLPPGQKRK